MIYNFILNYKCGVHRRFIDILICKTQYDQYYNFFVQSWFYIPTLDCFWWPFSRNRAYWSPERNQSSSPKWTLEISILFNSLINIFLLKY